MKVRLSTILTVAALLAAVAGPILHAVKTEPIIDGELWPWEDDEDEEVDL